MAVAKRSRTVGSYRLRGMLATVAVVLLLLVALVGCLGEADAGVPTFVPPTPRPTALAQGDDRASATATVTRGAITALVTAPGQIGARRAEELYFGAAGVLRTVYKESGDAVIAGERIAELDAYALERDVLQRKAELRIAQLNLIQVENLVGGQVLRATSPISVELAIGRERVALATSLYELALAQLDQAVVVAPFTGTLTSFSRQRGGRVNAYDTVGVIADLTDIHMVAWVPTGDAEGVAVGSAAAVEVLQQPGATYRAVVTEVASEATLFEGVWSYAVTLAWAPDETTAGLPPSLPLEIAVRIAGQTLSDALLLPPEAIRTFAGQTSVDIVQPDGTLRSVTVSTGLRTASQVAIVDGLEEGQIVALP